MISLTNVLYRPVPVGGYWLKTGGGRGGSVGGGGVLMIWLRRDSLLNVSNDLAWRVFLTIDEICHILSISFSRSSAFLGEPEGYRWVGGEGGVKWVGGRDSSLGRSGENFLEERGKRSGIKTYRNGFSASGHWMFADVADEAVRWQGRDEIREAGLILLFILHFFFYNDQHRYAYQYIEFVFYLIYIEIDSRLI